MGVHGKGGQDSTFSQSGSRDVNVPIQLKKEGVVDSDEVIFGCFCFACVYNICETVTFKVKNTSDVGLRWASRVNQKILLCILDRTCLQ